MAVVEIDRRHKLAYEDFVHEYLFPNKPVVLSGALDGWGAVAKWTPEYFKTKYGSMDLTIDGRDYTMAEFIDRVNSSSLRSEEHTSELQSHRDLHSFPTRRSSDLTPEYFKTKYGSMDLTIDGRDYTMAEFIDRVNSSSL